MAQTAKQHAETSLHRRKRKRLATSNERWLYLSAGEVGVMDSLQSLMGLTSLVCTVLNFQLAMALAVESVADGNTDMVAVNAVIDTVSVNLVTYLGLMGARTAADSILFDIPQHMEKMTFAFIDNSIDDCNVAYAGPHSKYPGAARREEYADAQQALYSGYTHRHGIRVETCFRPDGICTVFGPVSARHHDASVLRTSNLNSFLYELQLDCFTTTGRNPVFYIAFGDCAYNLGMQCI